MSSGQNLYLQTKARPNALDDKELQQQYADYVADGDTLGTASRKIGVCYRTVYRYAQSHPDFRKLIIESQALACDPVEGVLREKALEGKGWAVQYLLSNNMPSHYRSHRIDTDANRPKITYNTKINALKVMVGEPIEELGQVSKGLEALPGPQDL